MVSMVTTNKLCTKNNFWMQKNTAMADFNSQETNVTSLVASCATSR